MSKEDKDFLAKDVFNEENDTENTESTKAISLGKEVSDNTQQSSQEENSSDNLEVEERNIFDELESNDNSTGYASQFGELEEFVDSSTDENSEANAITENKKKPMSTKKISIIAVVSIIVVAAIALGVYFLFFNKSIKSGVWVPVTIDETTQEVVELTEDELTKQYYKFSDTKMIVCYGNGYATSESSCDLEHQANSFIMKDGSNLTLNYEITGNVIQGKFMKLTIAGYEDQPITYKWAPFVKMPKLNGPEFTKNEEILGYWKYENGMNVVYKEFTEDGITNDYVAYQGMEQKSTQMYNFDGENLTTLSAGGTNMYYETIEPGTEEKVQVTIEGDKLTISQNGYPIEFTKSTKEDYEKFAVSAMEGTYEYATVDYSQYETVTEATTETATALTEATEAVTEQVTE